MGDRKQTSSTVLTRRRLLRAAGFGSAVNLAGCSSLDIDGSTATEESPSANEGDDPSTTAETESLLDELSLREKAGQMTLLALNGSVPGSTAQRLVANPGVGGVLYGSANTESFDPQAVAETMNGYQRRVSEETDHGIPLVAGIDAVHGNATNEEAVVFPHNLGMGATWRPDLVRQRAVATSRSMRAMGFHWNFAPVADPLYDPRWGRFYEGFHEFPSAVSKFVRAGVDGLQSDDGSVPSEVASSVKHFAGYSMSTAGNDRDDARIPVRDLREKVFPPFEAGIDSGANTIMSNSGSVNGMPVHASSWLQRTVLRDQLGFDGVLVSDWGDVWKLGTEHAYIGQGQFETGVKVVVNAGVDMYMANENPNQFVDAVVDHVENGEIPESRVDDAVARILRLKRKLGLFEDATVDPETVGERVVTERDHELAREAAKRSMTLLQNERGLPISDPDEILVTGPNADDPKAQHGGWTLGWQGLSGDATPPTTTVLDGIETQAPSGTTVRHVPTGRTELSNREEVASAAADADVVVAVLGEGAYAEKEGDIENLALPVGQRELVTTLEEAAAQTVGVLVAGRPRGEDHMFDALDAVLMAYYPGSKGGEAVARTLFGEVNPDGRLPFVWPNSTGDVPAAATTREMTPSEAVRYLPGYGQTYTDFQVTGVLPEPATVDPNETDRIQIEYTVRNTGDRTAEHLAHGIGLRIGDGTTTKPWPRLTNWTWTSVEAGEQQSVSFDVPVERFAVYDGDVNGDGEWVIPGGLLNFVLPNNQVQVQIPETVSLS